MQQYQKDFIKFILAINAIKFGEFKLKSGRISPYFFNAGVFNNGKYLAQLGKFYAAAIEANKLDFDVLFGPAYKGIPIATATAIALFQDFGKIVPYSFNRKEAKNYGEGGNIIGHNLAGKVVIIDDVITAGTAIYQAIDLINNADATAMACIVAIDREEKGRGNLSAINEIEQQHSIKVLAIINLSQLLSQLKLGKDTAIISKIERYQGKYCI